MNEIKTKNLTPAVVYPFETPGGFGVIRSLSMAGIPVIGLNYRCNFISFSRYFKPLICPDPAQNPKAFVEFLVDLGKKTGKTVLFVSEDIAAFLVSHHRTLLSEYFYYPYLDEIALSAGFNKWTMLQVAQKANIPAPRSFMPKTINDCRNQIADFTYPVIIKPTVSRFVIRDNHVDRIHEFMNTYGTKALRANNYGELLRLCGNLLSKGLDIIVQEEIPGNCEHLYETKFYFNDAGDSDTIVTTRKIRQFPADFGICSFGEVVECEIIKCHTQKFLRAIGYRGIGEIEFKYDARDGKFKFIELNPRANHWLSICTFNGFNLPLMQYINFTHFDELKKMHMVENVRWLHLESDLEYLFDYSLNRSSPYYISFKSYIKSLLSVPLVEAYLSLRDPLLGIVYIGRCVIVFCRKLLRNLIFTVTGIRVSKHRKRKI